MNKDNVITIAIDAMGGDQGLAVTIPGTVRALRKNKDLHAILVGQQELLEPRVKKISAKYRKRIQIKHAPEVVAMDESPVTAMRTKKQSSIRIAAELVKAGEAQALVSAGNTGALMAISKFVLRMLPGIDRPAISAILPTSKADQDVRMLDLGANLDCKPEHLAQFAIMGTVVSESELERPPQVGLLNVGAEEIKGNRLVKSAAEILESIDDINYIGYIEGDDVYNGRVDVVVCDGFVGNTMLKASEGAMKVFAKFLRREFYHDAYSKFVGFLARPVLKRLRKRFDPSRYNGASLLGLQGIVIKSHGGANAVAFASAIKTAKHYVKKDVITLIGSKVETLLSQRQQS